MSQRPQRSARVGCKARRVCFLLGFISAAFLFGARVSSAAPTPSQREEAKALYAEGRRLRAEGKVEAAIERLSRAHELAPTPVTRLELARSYVDAGRLVEAEVLLKTIPSMPVTSTETTKSRLAREDSAKLAGSIAQRVARVVVQVVPDLPGTEVTLDGKLWPTERLGVEAPVDPGDHLLAAVRAGRRAERAFRVGEADRLTLPIGVPDEEVPAAKRPPSGGTPPTGPLLPVRPSEPPPGESRSISPLVPAAFTLSGIALATGLVTGSIALSQVSGLQASCPEGVCSPDAGLGTHRTLTTTSTVAFIVAGGAAAVGLVIWVADASTPSPKPPASVRVELTGTTIALRGRLP